MSPAPPAARRVFAASRAACWESCPSSASSFRSVRWAASRTASTSTSRATASRRTASSFPEPTAARIAVGQHSMEIRAEITRQDYEAFRKHAEQRALVLVERPRFRLLIVAWAILAVLFTWAYTATDWAPRYILSAGFGIALGLVLFYWGSKLQHSDLSPEEGGYLL